MKTCCYYTRILHVLEALHRTHPKSAMGKHLATALDGWGDVYTLNDEEIFHALKEYVGNLEFDVPHEEEELEKILKEGMHLQMMFTDELLNEQEDE
jgi:hypothetical protein